MTSLSVNDLSHNAYRVLGLTAAATQMDIDAAARRMRIWDDPAHIPSTPNDAAWIGPVPRTKRDIETAVARLSDPECRIEERIWWFCETAPASENLAPPTTLLQEHDATIVQLHRALIDETGEKHLETWRALLDRIEALAASGDYLTWLIQVETDGDFEKRASPEEVAAAQSGLTARLHSALAQSIESALDDENFSVAREAIQLMQNSAGAATSAAVAAPADKVLGRLEDLLIQRCELLRDQVHQAWNTRKIAILKPACRRCLMEIPKQLVPLIEELTVLCASEPDRVQRAKIHGANVYIYTADALEGCYDFISAERALIQACTLVKGTTMESTLQRRMEALSLNARRQRLGGQPVIAPRIGNGGTVPAAGPFKTIGSGKQITTGSGWSAFPKRTVVVLAVVLASVLGRFISTNEQHSRTNDDELHTTHVASPPIQAPRLQLDPDQPQPAPTTAR